jgi:hypothetical protein
VVMMAANTKYSINSLFTPVPSLVFGSFLKSQESSQGECPSWANPLRFQLRFQEEPAS